jgi:hypothetical protein
MVELYDLGHDDGVLLAYRLIVQHSIDELLLWRPAIEAIFFKVFYPHVTSRLPERFLWMHFSEIPA